MKHLTGIILLHLVFIPVSGNATENLNSNKDIIYNRFQLDSMIFHDGQKDRNGCHPNGRGGYHCH